MAFTTYTLSGNIADLIGVDLNPSKIALYLRPSANVFTDGVDQVRVGDIEADVADDGTFTISGIPSSTTTLISYKATIRWEAADGSRPVGMTSGWFNVTANASFAVKWGESVVLTPVDVTALASITAAAALGATNDSATASFVGNPASATRAAANLVYAAKSAQTTVESGRLSVATLNTTIADRTAPGISGAMIGDSITDRNGPYGNGERTGVANSTAYYPQLAWFQHAAIAAGQRAYVPPTRNFGVSGKRTDEMVTEQVPLVLALNPLPSFCTVLGGTNDIGTRTAAQIITSLGSTYTALTAAGILVIAGTIPPSTVWDTAPELAKVCEVNRWIKKQATDRKGVHVVDFFTVLSDTAGAPRTGVLADGTHQSGKGAALMGAALAPVLTTLFPPLDVFPGPGDVTNLAVNPFGSGTAGAKGTGVTGSVATSWFAATADAGAVSAVASKVARTDSIPGEWTQFVITSGNLRFLSELGITTGFTIGESVQGIVEFQTDVNADTNTTQLEAYIASTGSANTAGTLSDTAGFDGTEVAWTRLPRAGVLRTPPMVIGSGTTGLALWVRIWGGSASTFRIGRCALVKV